MSKSPPSLALEPAPGLQRQREVRADRSWDDEADLVAAVQAGDRLAMAALFDRYSPDVLRMLRRVLGTDPDLADLVQEVFARVLRGIDQVHDPYALRGWISSIAVFVARECIRRRKRRWWLGLWRRPQDESDAFESGFEEAPTDWEAREALRTVYRILDSLSAEERLVFTLRFFEGMELTEVASACGFSLATAKRRIAKAREGFWAMAQHEPAVRAWMEGGER